MTRIKTSPHSIQRGIELRVLREQLGLDQDQAGVLIHRSDTVISFLENGGKVQVEKYGDALEHEYKMRLGQSSAEDLSWEVAGDPFCQAYIPSIEEPVESEPEDGLVRVDFQGDTLTAIERDGKVWVSVRRVCEALGVDFAGQWREIQKDQALCSCVDQWSTHDKMARIQPALLISTKGLMLWLAGISTSRVSPHTAQKLTAYKLECAEVLERHFFAKHQASPPSSSDLSTVLMFMAEQNRQTLMQVAELNRQAQKDTLLLVGQIISGKTQEIQADATKAAKEAAQEAITQEQERSRQEVAEELFIPPMGKPQPKGLRADINLRRDNFVRVRWGGVGHSEANKLLYAEFRARYGIDLPARAAAWNRKEQPAQGSLPFGPPRKGSAYNGFDVAQSMGLIKDLHAVACEIFDLRAGHGSESGPSATHAGF